MGELHALRLELHRHARFGGQGVLAGRCRADVGGELEHLALLVVQLAHEPIADAEDRCEGEVTRVGDMLRDLVEFLRVDDVDREIAAVDRAGLHRGEGLRPRDRHRIGPERLVGVDHHHVLRNAILERLEVLDAVDRRLGVVDVAERHQRNLDHVDLGVLRHVAPDLLADRAVDDAYRVLVALEHVGQHQQVDLRIERPGVVLGDHGAVEGAELQLLEHVLLAAHLEAAVDLHLDLAARQGREPFGEGVHERAVGMLIAGGVADVHDHLGRCRHHRSGCHRDADQGAQQHGTNFACHIFFL